MSSGAAATNDEGMTHVLWVLMGPDSSILCALSPMIFSTSVWLTLNMMPSAIQVIQMEDPPALKNGKVCPVTGIKFVATLMLTSV